MSRPIQGLVLAAVLAATVLGFAALYRLRLAQGDVYPQYSSLRSDPLGTRALYESLAELPGMRVERGFQALARLPSSPPRTIVLAGMNQQRLAFLTTEDFRALDGAVRGGSRLVVAMRSDFAADRQDYGEDEPPPDPEAGKADRKDADAKKKEGDKKPADAKADAVAPKLPPRMAGADVPRKAPMFADLKRLWGIAVGTHKMEIFDKGAVLDAGAPQSLPKSLPWKSGVYFDTQAGMQWSTVYSDFGKPVIVEMPYGRGSVVFAADSYFLSNEALLKSRATPLLAWVVGPNARVVFDESHLGVQEDVGIAALARRYGMAWAFATLVLLAVLFVWRRMAAFIPPPAEMQETALSCSHTAALEELFLRSVAPADLIAACSAEWRRSAPPKAVARLEAALAAHPDSPAPAAYNAAVRALKRRQDFSQP